MKNSKYLLSQDLPPINALKQTARTQLPYLQAIVDRYQEESKSPPAGYEALPKMTVTLLNTITRDPNRIDQLVLDAIPDQHVNGVPIKKEMLDLPSWPMAKTKAAIAAYIPTTKYQRNGNLPISEAFILSKSFVLSVAEPWEQAVEESHTRYAETDVEKYVVDKLLEAQQLMEEVKARTGLRLALEDLTYPGDKNNFQPIIRPFGATMRSWKSNHIPPPEKLKDVELAEAL